MSTINNIYVLNYLLNRQISRKGESLVLFFLDLEVAFDSMDRSKLIATMREREEGGIGKEM